MGKWAIKKYYRNRLLALEMDYVLCQSVREIKIRTYIKLETYENNGGRRNYYEMSRGEGHKIAKTCKGWNGKDGRKSYANRSPIGNRKLNSVPIFYHPVPCINKEKKLFHGSELDTEIYFTSHLLGFLAKKREMVNIQ